MALQGKCPEAIKDKSSSASRKTHFMPGSKKRIMGSGDLFILTVRNVWLLLLLILILSTHHPSTVTSITVWAENVASVLCPPHTLQLLWLYQVTWKIHKAHIKIKHAGYNHSLSRTGWYSIQVTGLTLSYGAVTCVAGMCWMAHCFSRSQMTMRPRP